MSDSRIAGLYRLGVPERIRKLRELGWLSETDASRLLGGYQVLSTETADRMIENVIGVFGLPLAIAPNFLVNDRECLAPLVVEEPSVVAGLSHAAALARRTGGFEVSNNGSLLIGQVHVHGVSDPDHGIEVLENAKPELLEAANAVHPRLAARGGGVRDLEIRLFAFPDGAPLIALHVLVDTCDAMGANLVNEICEAIAPDVEAVCGGRVALRILSNLADRSLYTARAQFALPDDVRDAIVIADAVAQVDPYRAATHNKGVMNGIDALAIATGNDWRAIEAGVHAYASADGHYRSLTRWSVADDGILRGEITVPIKVGIVGGTLKNNRAAELGLALTGSRSAQELAELMAAVGLAQNFAALRALGTSGIQAAHMKLHARSVVASAGAPDDVFDDVVTKLVASGEIKDWKAREILAELQPRGTAAADGSAAGKVILLGEHGVVYGRRALALPIPGAVRVSLSEAAELAHDLPGEFLEPLLDDLGVDDRGWRIGLDSDVPLGKGLGSSASIAVAIARAFNSRLGLGLDDERVNAIAFESEKRAHGTPSGVDNTLATYAKPMLFSSADGLEFDEVTLPQVPPLLVAWGHETGRTSEQVAAVRARYDSSPARFETLFDEMDGLAADGARLMRAGQWRQLGASMNICHGLLNAIGVSTPELERMVALARSAGAAGAKLTGAGGGGSIVAICPEGIGAVSETLRQAGYSTLLFGEQGEA